MPSKLKLVKGDKPYASFAPKGKSGLFIYAVVLEEHPEVVKIGRTVRWSSRRNQYANWNLHDGDAIRHEVVFTINDEFIDLAALEAEILSRATWKRRHGTEWFNADVDDVKKHIEEVLCEAGISYIVE